MAARGTRGTNKAALLQQMADLKKKIDEADAQERLRIGKLAERAGCLKHDIPDDDYLAAFQALARRFQDGGSERVTAPSAPASSSIGANAAA